MLINSDTQLTNKFIGKLAQSFAVVRSVDYVTSY